MDNDKFEKWVEFTPAFDKRNPDPSKNYGIHGVNIKFLLRGEKGVIQFVIYANWQLPHVTKEYKQKFISKRGTIDETDIDVYWLPLPADLGYHSPKPMYDGQPTATDNCEYLGGKPCYYDGSGLAANDVFNILLVKGGDAVWKSLEETYHSRFED